MSKVSMIPASHSKKLSWRLNEMRGTLSVIDFYNSLGGSEVIETTVGTFGNKLKVSEKLKNRHYWTLLDYKKFNKILTKKGY